MIFVIISIFIIWNLLRKNEKAEDIILAQQEYLEKISSVIKFTDEELKKIDEKNTFKSDDEVGFFFTQIKGLQEILNNFKLK
jgi:hypothetical protein